MLGLREGMEENGSAPGTGEAKRSAAAPADPEVVDRPLRRRFSPWYKLRIVEKADRCTEPGEVGQLLRREGLYSSHLTTPALSRNAAASRSEILVPHPLLQLLEPVDDDLDRYNRRAGVSGSGVTPWVSDEHERRTVRVHVPVGHRGALWASSPVPLEEHAALQDPPVPQLREPPSPAQRVASRGRGDL